MLFSDGTWAVWGRNDNYEVGLPWPRLLRPGEWVEWRAGWQGWVGRGEGGPRRHLKLPILRTSRVHRLVSFSC